MANVSRMRTIRQCAEYFKKEDSETRVSEHLIRSLAKTKRIPVIYAGTRQLINLDVLIAFLSNDQMEEQQEVNNYGILRRVGE